MAFILSIHRSASPFCQGLRREVLTGRMAIDRTAIGTSRPYLASRSKMRNPGGMSCDVEMQHTPSAVADHEKAVEHTEGDGRHGEEVHGGDSFAMITQKGAPAPSQLGVSRGSVHPAGDGSFRDIEAWHQEFSVDARGAPSRILSRYPKDEIADFCRNPSSANHLVGLGNRAPVERESKSVPTHNGIRAHDNESPFPSGPEPSCQNPEELIERCQTWAGMLSLQCNELLAKSQVFKKECVSSREEAKDCGYEQPNGIDHPGVLSHFSCGRQCCMLLKS